jgi:hypothetical protein
MVLAYDHAIPAEWSPFRRKWCSAGPGVVEVCRARARLVRPHCGRSGIRGWRRTLPPQYELDEEGALDEVVAAMYPVRVLTFAFG